MAKRFSPSRQLLRPPGCSRLDGQAVKSLRLDTGRAVHGQRTATCENGRAERSPSQIPQLIFIFYLISAARQHQEGQAYGPRTDPRGRARLAEGMTPEAFLRDGSKSLEHRAAFLKAFLSDPSEYLLEISLKFT